MVKYHTFALLILGHFPKSVVSSSIFRSEYLAFLHCTSLHRYAYIFILKKLSFMAIHET